MSFIFKSLRSSVRSSRPKTPEPKKTAAILKRSERQKGLTFHVKAHADILASKLFFMADA